MRMEALDGASRLMRQQARVERLRPAPPPLVYDPGPLLDFIPAISPHLQRPTWLEPVALEFHRIRDLILAGDPEENVETCFAAPPGHTKSELVKHGVVWLLVQFPILPCLYVTYGHDLAKLQAIDMMRLAKEAGVQLGATQNQDFWETSSGGSLTALGAEGALTGRRWRVVVGDDLHKNRAEAESKRIRKTVVDGVKANILTREHPLGSHYLFMNTRWHIADVVGELTKPVPREDEEDEEIKPFRYYSFPALKTDGTALAPQLFSAARLRRKRARIGKAEFDSLYQQQPRPSGGILFVGATLLDELPAGGRYRYAIGIDLARTARTRSDYQAAVVMRADLESKPRAYDIVEVVHYQGTLTDRVLGRGELPEPQLDEGFIRRLHALAKKYPGAPLVMFTSKDETSYIALMARHDKYPVRVRATLAESDKWRRAQPYATAWNDPAGLIRLPRNAAWLDAFVTEHVDFTGDPKDGRDDQVDAAAAAFDALSKRNAGSAGGTNEGSEAARHERYAAG